jgi:homoserine kinase
VAFAPENVPPVAVQEVALVELQVSVELPPLAIVVGLAVSVAVGLGAMATVAVAAVLVPPAPVHVNE